MTNGLRDLIAQHLAALALWQGPAPPIPRSLIAAMLGLHLLGLAAVWRYFQQPVWFALPTLALFAAFPLLVSRPRGAFAVETLAPLFFLYAILLARVMAIRILVARVPYQDEASLADPRLIFFQVEVTAVVAIVYTALTQIARLARGAARTRGFVSLSLVLFVAALVWFAAETIGHRTRGVTASDPYAYAQMAVDLATRGSPLHSYPLFRDVANLSIAWYPIEHVGYRLIDNLAGDAPTVWPIGGSIWLALAYRILGEEGLYLATPLAALASLLLLAFLVWEYFSEEKTLERAALAAISVALLATSWEQVDRSMVPLVDTQAQLFSILAIFFALRATRGERIWIFGALCGLALGAAYFARHTQVLLAIPVVVAAWPMRTHEKFRFLAAAAIASFVIVLPDLFYHQQYFGGWLTPESNELALFSISNLLPGLAALSERFFAGNEFGYLILFCVYGTYRAARNDLKKFSVLAAWVVLLVAFHLLYAAVKMRDLLPEFPPVILWTAFGVLSLARDLREWAYSRVIASPEEPVLSVAKEAKQSPTPPHSLPLPRGGGGRGEMASSPRNAGFLAMTQHAIVALAIFLALLLPAMRTRLTILRPFQPVKVTFGYVTRAQRASFDQIAALTPQNSVIGSAMNDGPIDLYARRATFRPGVWNSAERAIFVDAMQRDNRPVFLLDDGAETSAARRDLSVRYQMRRVAVLDVPLFGSVGEMPAVLWEIVK